MEDSFFGFDTSAPVEDDGGGGIEEPSEEEYDALNDETFGSAINGDWEEAHENLVRLSDGVKGRKAPKAAVFEKSIDDDENSDLEINFSRVNLDDVDIGFDDSECRIQLDPSVWANPVKPASSATMSKVQNMLYSNPEIFLRQHFSNPFEIVPPQTRSVQPQMPTNNLFGLSNTSIKAPKICTVEDIERNIRNQQQQRQQVNAAKSKTPIPSQHMQPLQIHTQQQLQQPQLQPQPQQQQQSQPQQHQPHANGNFFNRSVAPPGFNNAPRPNFNFPPQHPINNMHSAQHRMPPGFPPPMTMLPGHGGPPPLPHFQRPMHTLPIALNNFAMHPNFNAMRPVGAPMCPPRMPPHLTMLTNMPPTSVNQFNQRLVQEIQQNHPMLANVRNQLFNNITINSNSSNNNNNSSQQHGLQNNQNRQDKKQQNLRSNGNLPDEYDEYANLMSTRDKHWLIGIQLSQLNTDTPYVDDYYYTIFKERKAKMSGDTSQSKAHKDNQLNHPLTQPKGHAQLVLISMGKNGTNNRNGQNRERRNSESKNDKEQLRIYTHTPLQFENSLGKLQYGSVTAPRKIIDMDIMGAEGSPQLSTSLELSAQRKSRHILLHIETLYRILLKLEDLQNPSAIASSLILKERKEKEKQLALEQAMLEALIRPMGSNDKAESNATSVNSSISDKFSFEIESKDKLLTKLLPGLTHDKIVGMMNIRKGKNLIRRIMPHIEDNPIRWAIWVSIFASLQTVIKKDKDDNEGALYALYPEFKKQIKAAEFENLIEIAYSMPLGGDKKINGLFSSKFCISSLVAIILRAEQLYATNTDENLSESSKKEWSEFLNLVSTTLNKTIQHQTISAAIESDAVQPMVDHFSRFKDLKLDSLLALFSQAKQQIN